MSDPRDLSQRRQSVQDGALLRQWYATERAAEAESKARASRDRAVARLASCTAWSVVILTAVLMLILLLDAYSNGS